MPIYDVVAAHDLPSYGVFTVEAETPRQALDAAIEQLRDGSVLLDQIQGDCAHGLRIVTLQLDDQDALYEDVELDVEAPMRSCPQVALALLRTTLALADLIGSLGEADQYPDALTRIADNLRLADPIAAAPLVTAREHQDADDWLAAVAAWARPRCETPSGGPSA